MIQIILLVLVLLLVVATLLPFVHNDFWTFKILEYPRLQKLVISFVILFALFVCRSYLDETYWYAFSGAGACCIYLCTQVFPYTPVSPIEMKRTRTLQDGHSLKIITANVLQKNSQYHLLRQLLRKHNADIILLVETDEAWNKAMQELETDYPHQLKKVQDDTYGMLFYSRMPLRNARVVHRVHQNIPSIETELQLHCGKWIKLYGLHPKPPVPGESLTSTAKDKELMKVALEIEKTPDEPCIVMGDLNDVAWSHVTKLFRKISGLLDPRRGRGFFSTFSADHWWVRFPLDYVFCSYHFGLIQMRRLPHFGSDHFAMYIHLQYAPMPVQKQERPDAEEEKEAVEIATEEEK